jgi:tetratricopeptide (TPR) repeat protein
MCLTRSLVIRFLLTYGLLFLAILVPLSVYHQPIKKYILETQQITASKAKSQVLGYQTPNFKLLAQDLLNAHVFKPEEMDTYINGRHYLSFYKKGSELFPELFEMPYMLGVCYFWQGDLPSAERSLRQSLQINPVFFWAYYNLGLLYLKSGQFDAAIALFSRAREIPPPLTLKLLHDIQAFFIIWGYMPDPQGYINVQLQKADEQIKYLLMVSLACKNHHAADVHFDPDQWNPVFF